MAARPSLRAVFRQLMRPDATDLGLVVLLDTNSAFLDLPEAEVVAVFDGLARLSERPNARVAFIGGDDFYRLRGRDYAKDGPCDYDNPVDDVVRFTRQLAGELVSTVRNVVLLHICGRWARLPVVEGHAVVVVRIGPFRNQADYVLPSLPALARFLAFLDREFVGERGRKGHPEWIV